MSKNKDSVESLRQSTNSLLVEYWSDLKALSRLELEKVIADLEAPVLRVAVAKGLLECARTGIPVVDLLNRIDPMPHTHFLQTMMTSVMGKDLQEFHNK